MTTTGPNKSGNRVKKHTKKLNKPEKKRKITQPTDKMTSNHTRQCTLSVPWVLISP